MRLNFSSTGKNGFYFQLCALELTDLPVSAPQVLGLKVCITIFCLINFLRPFLSLTILNSHSVIPLMVLLSQMLGVVLLILEFGGLVCHFERWAHFQPPSHTCVCENPEWPRLRVILQERLLMSHPQGRHRHSLAPGSRFQELCRLPRAEESPRPWQTYSVISVQIGRVFYWYPFQWMLSLLVSRQGGRV